MRVALYARVSTDLQSVDMQVNDLESVAAKSGWTIVATHIDHGISGGKGRDKRPGLDALWKQVTRREVDMVAAWSVDRLGRSLPHLIALMGEMDAKGCALYLHKQGLDTSTPAGKMMFQMLGVFAEFERAMIRERVRAGVARARANGARWGREGVSAAVQDRIMALKADGNGYDKIAAAAGVAKSTVRDVVKRFFPSIKDFPEPCPAVTQEQPESRRGL